MSVKVVNYETGNLSSVVSALDNLGISSSVVTHSSEIQVGDTILLPGVGSFDRAAHNLRSGGFHDYDFLGRKNKVIGICLGFHLMCRGSEEGVLPGLGLFESQVFDFQSRVEPFLNLGWCDVQSPTESFTESHYFCHRYFVASEINTKAHINRDGLIVTNVMNRGSYWGIQSHPERSGVRGLRLLQEVLRHEP